MRISASARAGVIGTLLTLLSMAPGMAASFVSADYRLPATLDTDIASDVKTEIWATLWRPATLAAAPYPLVVFLHGNHGTCGRIDDTLGIRVDDRVDYTFSGTCPNGYTVSPSHLGYAYLAERLATVGYIVVSINANRGVNAADGTPDDSGLNLRRGKLVLKHLQFLRGWNARGGAPASLGFNLRGKLDLGQIGLVGHSRGGEGMRAALALYREPRSPWKARIGPIGLKALYEIGPVDGQTSRTLDALGVAWNVLLPYCDGDVSDLEGVHPFDRMMLAAQERLPRPKSTFAVYGANHNFYNTEWQESDSPGCIGPGNEAMFPEFGGSAPQRQTAVASIVPFMRAFVGRNARPELGQMFNPDRPLPAQLEAITRIDRGYTDTPDSEVVARIDDFEQPTGSSSSGQPTLARDITIENTSIPSHDERLRGAAISWIGEGRPVFETYLTPLGRGQGLAEFQTLEFRVSRQCRQDCSRPHPLNGAGPTNLTIQIIRPNGSLSAPVQLVDYLDLRGPVGAAFELVGDFDELHPILETARIPLSAFGLQGPGSMRGVRFAFDRTPQGAIYLANIRLSERSAAATGAVTARLQGDLAAEAAGTPQPTAAAAAAPSPPSPARGAIVAIRRVSAGTVELARSTAPGADIEIEVAADRALPVTDALPALAIGDKRIQRSRFAPGGGTERMVFSLDAQTFADLPDGAPVVLRVGANWRTALGALDKSLLP